MPGRVGDRGFKGDKVSSSVSEDSFAIYKGLRHVFNLMINVQIYYIFEGF